MDESFKKVKPKTNFFLSQIYIFHKICIYSTCTISSKINTISSQQLINSLSLTRNIKRSTIKIKKKEKK